MDKLLFPLKLIPLIKIITTVIQDYASLNLRRYYVLLIFFISCNSSVTVLLVLRENMRQHEEQLNWHSA